MGYSDPVKKREYQNNWMRARRKKWLEEHGPCKECGSWDNLEVDHVDRSTKVDHKVWSWSLARMQAELAKCQVLCESCHKLKSKQSRDHVNLARAKLTPDEVIQIRRLLADGAKQREVAKQFGISNVSVCAIKNGRRWMWL